MPDGHVRNRAATLGVRHLRWYIAALLFASTVINYIDRQALSVVAPVLTKDLGLSDVEYSNVLQAFLLPYTVMYLVSGLLVDRWGTRISLTVFMAWWSASNALHMVARSAVQLSAFRFLLGVGEPGNYMAAGRAISEWYPAQERGFVNGLVNAGSSMGAVIAAPIVVWITIRFGWRTAFLATGCMGIAWLLPWLFFYRLPDRNPRITPEELRHIQGTNRGGAGRGEAPIPWFSLLKYRETWGLLLARFLTYSGCRNTW
jgi:ACS family hexuronate transporter-like MFS transporter